ncbi:hypothetical protein SEA_ROBINSPARKLES_111 [Gordonia phage RobinSparkles]|nr:hypothetical protein SEA_ROBINSPARKLES_111 [Gordonia phage RobinSparkles]
MRVTVTQKHIDKGLPCRSYACPIAEAINDKGYVSSVTDESVYITSKSEAARANNSDDVNWKKYTLPKSAKQFVNDFDSGKKVKPFTFEMRKR